MKKLLVVACLLFLAHAAHAASPAFTTDLHVGMNDPQVTALQHYLNTHGFPVAASGPGALGGETVYFGAMTRQALVAFQNAHAADILVPLGLTSGTGNFFIGTRKYLNGLAASEVGIPMTSGAPRTRYRYAIGGTVSGLLGTGLVLTDGGGNTVAVVQNGTFTIGPAIASGAYQITVRTDPSSPSQTCVVANGTGTVPHTNVTNIAVTCTTNTHAVTSSGDGHESITPSTAQLVADGSTQAFVVTADSGYTVSNTVGGTCPLGSWSGGTYTTGAITTDCSVSFSADASSFTLTVSRGGNATGTVVSSPAGISCGATCSASLASGAMVTLTATPDADVTFGGWSGACSGFVPVCMVSMDAAKAVMANFVVLMES